MLGIIAVSEKYHLPSVFKAAVRQQTLVKIAVRRMFPETTACQVFLKTAVRW